MKTLLTTEQKMHSCSSMFRDVINQSRVVLLNVMRQDIGDHEVLYELLTKLKLQGHEFLATIEYIENKLNEEDYKPLTRKEIYNDAVDRAYKEAMGE